MAEGIPAGVPSTILIHRSPINNRRTSCKSQLIYASVSLK